MTERTSSKWAHCLFHTSCLLPDRESHSEIPLSHPPVTRVCGPQESAHSTPMLLTCLKLEFFGWCAPLMERTRDP